MKKNCAKSKKSLDRNSKFDYNPRAARQTNKENNKQPTKQEAMKTMNELVKFDRVNRIATSAETLIATDPAGNAYNNVLFLNSSYTTARRPGACLRTKPQPGDIIIRWGFRRLGEGTHEYHVRAIANALTRPSIVRAIGWVDGERKFGYNCWQHVDSNAVVDTDGGIWLLGGNPGSGMICHERHITGGLRADFYSVAGNRTMPKNAPAWLSHWDGKRVKGYMGSLYIKTATEIFKANAVNNIWRVVKKSGAKVRLSTVQTAFARAMRDVVPAPSERWRACGHVGTVNYPPIAPEQINCVAAMLSTPTGIAYIRAVERGDKFYFAANR